ncbi:MAG: DUF3052 family protein [Xanthomonadales bacterium]|nr:DUF3052 family protein [Xanthomonadales bacterium]
MAGYSGKPLFEKLGIKLKQRLYVMNPPDDYYQLIAPMFEQVVLLTRATSNIDLAHVFTTKAKELAQNLNLLIHKINPDGMIWVSWPKKSSKVATDITEDTIREICLPMGLVDVKVCAVDDIWSGLKLVIRKELRNRFYTLQKNKGNL